MTATGYLQSVYFNDEDKYGSTHVVNQSPGLVQSINPTETNNLIKVKTLGGAGRDYTHILPGKFEVSGSFEYFLQGGAFLRQAIGEDTATAYSTVDSGPKYHTGGTSDNGYLHIMGSAASPLADAFPSFTLEFADHEDTGVYSTTSNLKRLYTGCRVNTLGINATIDEPVRVNVDWQAQGVQISTGANTSVSESTDNPYIFYQGAVYATSGTISDNTALTSTSAVAEVNSFDLSVNNNLEPVWYISGTTTTTENLRGLKKLLVKGRDYDATLNLHFRNKTMYERFLGTTDATEPQTTLGEYDIALDFTRSGSIGTYKALGDDYMRIVLKDCKFNEINIPGTPEDIVNETIDVDVRSAKFYVVDTDASYE